MSQSSVTLNWDGDENALYYRVYRCAPSGQFFVPLDYWVTKTFYVDNTADKYGRKNQYKVQSCNPMGLSQSSFPSEGYTDSPFRDFSSEYNLVSSDDYDEQCETIGTAIAANGLCSMYDCCIAGLDPTDPTARFEARIAMIDGEPVVTPFPDLGTNRVYTVVGKSSLSDPDEDWHEPDENSQFFRVKVSLPE